MIAALCLMVGVAAGAALGWASRPHAHWCPQCGRHLTCLTCNPVTPSVSGKR